MKQKQEMKVTDNSERKTPAAEDAAGGVRGLFSDVSYIPLLPGNPNS